MAITVVTPSDPAGMAAWLKDKGLSVPSSNIVWTNRLIEYGISVLPTIAIITADTVVTDAIEGVVPRQLEEQFLARVRDATAPHVDRTYDAMRVPEHTFKRSGATITVDLRAREAFQQSPASEAVNIPIDELAQRAPIELLGRGPVVIDCRLIPASQCRAGSHMLLDIGVSELTLLVTQ